MFAAFVPALAAPSPAIARPLLPAIGNSQPGFTLLSPSLTGITFTNQLTAEAEGANHNLLNGSGVALGDYDGDGWCDIFLCNLNGSSRLYRNLGNWKFADLTDASSLADTNQLARAAVFADIDGNRTLDLLVTYSGAGARIFLNDGQGKFKDAQRAELSDRTGSMSIALGDVNGDGALDLFIANYGENTIRSGARITTRMVGGREVVTGRNRNRLRIIDGKLVERGEPSAFYYGDGKGGFRKVSWTSGAFLDETGATLTQPLWDLSLTATIRDVNGDGHPDIYVCNDFQDPDRFWLGDGQGRFRAAPRESVRSTPHFSMAADFADLNGDGLDDYFVTDMLSRVHTLRMRQTKPASPHPAWTGERDWDRPQVRRNFLYLNRGDGSYADIANYAGVAASDWSWSTAFLDVDLDGHPDILVANGHYYDPQDLDAIHAMKTLSPSDKNDGRKVLSLFPRALTPNDAFRNRGDLTFEETGGAWGFDSLQVSHSIALGDLDNDGDLDVVVNCLRAPALVYRNNSPAPRLTVKLEGVPPNTEAVGARLSLRGGPVPLQTQTITSGGRFLAGDATLRTFAAGSNRAPMTLEIVWPNGKHSTITNLAPNHRYRIQEAAVAIRPPPSPSPPPPALFANVSAVLGHRHSDPPYDDFPRQPSLPRRFSQLGPGVAWTDLNNDGLDDLVIGGGKGASLGVYLNQGNGQWLPFGGAFTNALPDDSAGIVAAVLIPGVRSLLIGVAQYEDTSPGTAAALRYDLTAGKATTGRPIPGPVGSCGPLAIADADGDGDLDLFIGSRLQAGRYPEPANSMLARNDGQQLVPEAIEALKPLGLVTAAVFSDLTGDGLPELVVTSEWGPLHILRKDQGKWTRWNPPLRFTSHSPLPQTTNAMRLADLLGLWTSAATGDLDGDGRIDLVVGNWGLNSTLQPGPGPFYLYYGDLNNDRSVQIVEAFLDPSSGQALPMRGLELMEKSLPWLRARFPTHQAYAKATVSEILRDRARNASRLAANFLASVVLLNQGDAFELRALPPEAQWSPVMGIAVADLDGDGREDIFLAQNYFAVRPEDGRMDSGRGLLLRGNGSGGFEPVSGQESGLIIYGEQRGCAVADYDRDGRADLVVTQNNSETRLYHNVTARPGLRVRLQGPPGNPDAIGAVLRLEYVDRQGPAREIQAGSGFWSQNSPVQILGLDGQPTALRIVWPGGKTSRHTLANAVPEIHVTVPE